MTLSLGIGVSVVLSPSVGLPEYFLADFTSGSIPAGFSFSRPDSTSGIATVIDPTSKRFKAVASDNIRLDRDPITGTPRGFLVERQIVQLNPYPVELTNAAYQAANLTLTANSGDSKIDGVQYTKLYDNATLNGHSLSIASVAIPSGVVTIDAIVKADTHTWCQLIGASTPFGSNVWVNFDLANVATGNKGSAVLDSGIRALGDGAFHIWVTANATSGTGRPGALVLTNGQNTSQRSPSYMAVTPGGILATGFECYAGYVKFSRSLNSGSSATKAADQLTAALSLVNFNPAEGTVMIEFEEYTPPTSLSGAHRLFQMHNGSSAGQIGMGIVPTNGSTPPILDASVTNPMAGAACSDFRTNGGLIAAASAVQTRIQRAAFSFKKGQYRCVLNGMNAATPSSLDTTVDLPALVSLALGHNGYNVADVFSGWITKFWYWPRELSEAEKKLATVAPANQGYVDFAIFFGQSNDDGRAAISAMSALLTTFYSTTSLSRMPPNNIYIYYHPTVRSGGGVTAGSLTAAGGQWNVLSSTHEGTARLTHQVIGNAGSTVAAQTLTQFGPELKFAYNYAQAYPGRELRIVKAAVGGASILTDWDIMNAGPTKLWYWFKNYLWAPAIADVIAQGKTPRIILCDIMEGETDADNSMSQADFQTYLQKFVDRINTELGYPVQKIIIEGLGNGVYNSTAGNRIKAAQAAVAAANANTVFMATDGSNGQPAITLNADNIHYNAPGQETRGDRQFAAITS